MTPVFAGTLVGWGRRGMGVGTVCPLPTRRRTLDAGVDCSILDEVTQDIWTAAGVP